jgi:hypothetical protein
MDGRPSRIISVRNWVPNNTSMIFFLLIEQTLYIFTIDQNVLPIQSWPGKVSTSSPRKAHRTIALFSGEEGPSQSSASSVLSLLFPYRRPRQAPRLARSSAPRR